MADDRILVFNPDTQGGRAQSRLRGGVQRVEWDQPVRSIPAPSAHDLVRLGGLLYALTPADAAERYGLTEQTIKVNLTKGTIAGAEYQPAEGDPIRVVVLDKATDLALRAKAGLLPDDVEVPAPTTTEPAQG